MSFISCLNLSLLCRKTLFSCWMAVLCCRILLAVSKPFSPIIEKTRKPTATHPHKTQNLHPEGGSKVQHIKLLLLTDPLWFSRAFTPAPYQEPYKISNSPAAPPGPKATETLLRLTLFLLSRTNPNVNCFLSLPLPSYSGALGKKLQTSNIFALGLLLEDLGPLGGHSSKTQSLSLYCRAPKKQLLLFLTRIIPQSR